MSQDDSRAQAQAAINQARKAAKRGDLIEAERWSKAAARLADAARTLGAIAPPPDPEEDVEELRLELRRRLLLYVEADLANQHCDKLREAGVLGLPPQEPFSEHDLEDIAMGRRRELTGKMWLGRVHPMTYQKTEPEKD